MGVASVKVMGEMKLTELISQYPSTIEVFIKYGMGCLGCAAAHFESIEEGALAHGIDVEDLLRELNKSVEEENNTAY